MVSVRREYVLYSLVAGAWAASITLLGERIGWGDDAEFWLSMAIVPVVILVWGHRDAVKKHAKRIS
jgi:hypothetical protein